VAAGTFNVRFLDFALGTLIGMAPGIFAIAIFGERLDHAIRSPGVGNFAVLALLVALVVLASGWIRRRLGREEQPARGFRGAVEAHGDRRDRRANETTPQGQHQNFSNDRKEVHLPRWVVRARVPASKWTNYIVSAAIKDLTP
jgi:hypothetical protein